MMWPWPPPHRPPATARCQLLLHTERIRPKPPKLALMSQGEGRGGGSAWGTLAYKGDLAQAAAVPQTRTVSGAFPSLHTNMTCDMT